MYHMVVGERRVERDRKKRSERRKQIPYTNIYVRCVSIKAMNLSHERNEDIIWGQIFI